MNEKTHPKPKIGAVVSVTDINGELVSFTSPHTGKEVHISDADEALQWALDNADDPVELDDASDRRLRRKIDLYLLPLICILYCFQYMDKLTNSYASILGLRKDLDMEGNMYAWTGSAFYIGYLFFELPAAYILQRLPVARTVLVFIVVWGVVLGLHAVPNYAGFVALRTVLGMLESTVTPAFVIITGQWYKKEEVFLRTAIWFSFNGLGTILGSGAVAYGVFEHAESYSIAAWKVIFIATGVLTVVLGIAVFFHIPDTPAKAWFLTEREKRLVVERIRGNHQGFGNRHFKKDQFVEALCDVQTWIFFFFAVVCNIPNGGITNFQAILMNEKFGYTTKKTLLMGTISGAVELVGCTGFAYCYRFFPNRLFWAIMATLVMFVGVCLLAFAKDKAAEFAGLALYGLVPVGLICMLASVASNVTGHTKKVTVNAILLIGYCVGNLIGPQTFVATEAPDYRSATVTIVACGALSVVLLVVLWAVYYNANKARDARAVDGEYENVEFADLTDKQNPLFRYII